MNNYLKQYFEPGVLSDDEELPIDFSPIQPAEEMEIQMAESAPPAARDFQQELENIINNLDLPPLQALFRNRFDVWGETDTNSRPSFRVFVVSLLQELNDTIHLMTTGAIEDWNGLTSESLSPFVQNFSNWVQEIPIEQQPVVSTDQLDELIDTVHNQIDLNEYKFDHATVEEFCKIVMGFINKQMQSSNDASQPFVNETNTSLILETILENSATRVQSLKYFKLLEVKRGLQVMMLWIQFIYDWNLLDYISNKYYITIQNIINQLDAKYYIWKYTTSAPINFTWNDLIEQGKPFANIQPALYTSIVMRTLNINFCRVIKDTLYDRLPLFEHRLGPVNIEDVNSMLDNDNFVGFINAITSPNLFPNLDPLSRFAIQLLHVSNRPLNWNNFSTIGLSSRSNDALFPKALVLSDNLFYLRSEELHVISKHNWFQNPENTFAKNIAANVTSPEFKEYLTNMLDSYGNTDMVQDLSKFIMSTRGMVNSRISQDSLLVGSPLFALPFQNHILHVCRAFNISYWVVKAWFSSNLYSLLAWNEVFMEVSRHSINIVLNNFVNFWRGLTREHGRFVLKNKMYRQYVYKDRTVQVIQTLPLTIGNTWNTLDFEQAPILDIDNVDLIEMDGENGIPRVWQNVLNNLQDDLESFVYQHQINRGIEATDISVQFVFSYPFKQTDAEENVDEPGRGVGEDVNDVLSTKVIASGFKDIILQYFSTAMSPKIPLIWDELEGIRMIAGTTLLRNAIRNHLFAALNELQNRYQQDFGGMSVSALLSLKIERIYWKIYWPRVGRKPDPNLRVYGKKVYNLNRNQLFSNGLCLLETYYYIMTQDEPIDKNGYLLQLIDWFSKLTQELKSILLNGNIAEFVEYTQESVPVYIYHSKQLIYREDINDEDLVIFVKDGHCWPNRWAGIKVGADNLQMKKPFIFRRLPNKPSKESRMYAWDIEAFPENGRFIVYCICVVDAHSQMTFWGLDAVDKFCNWLRGVEEDVCLWSFNGRKFDHIFMVKELIRGLGVKIVGGENDIIAMHTSNLHFKDLRLVFGGGSLKYLANLFKTEHQKTEIEFANINRDTYNNLKDDIVKYCINDCLVLYELAQKFKEITNNIVFKGEQYIGAPSTAAGLALDVFKTLFIPKGVVIKGSPREIYEIERANYYGGMTCVFKHKGVGLYYYDINSSYPWSMVGKQKYSMPIDFKERKVFAEHYRWCSILKHFVNDKGHGLSINADNLYRVKWKFREEFSIPFFPVRTVDGLIYPRENMLGDWRWGELILLATSRGLVEVMEIHEQISYHLRSDIFVDYINHFYELKSSTKHSNPTMCYFYKLLLNSLYGKFGQRQFDEKLYVNPSEISEFINDEEIKFKLLDEDVLRVDIKAGDGCEGLFSCVRLASRITASSLCTLVEGMLSLDVDPFESVKHVYYCDTDSITCDRPMPAHMVSDSQLGKWKLEKELSEAIFWAPKNYWMKTKDNHHEVKIKGVKNENYRNREEEFAMDLEESKVVEVMNNDVFVRKWNNVLLQNQKKIIRPTNRRRLSINDNDTIPFNNILHYYQTYYANKKWFINWLTSINPAY